MKNKRVILNIVVLFFSIVATIYAMDTIRTYISETTSTGENSYIDQDITVLSGASLVNKNNDNSLLGDFFAGNYYDSAYGVFSFDRLDDNVKITSTSHSCSGNTLTHNGYELEGYSWNDEFGAMDFSDVYICVPKDENSDEESYIGGYASSQLVGFQIFDGIMFDVYVDRGLEHSSDARYTKIDGVTSSQNYEGIDDEFQDEVRVIGDIAKSYLKKQMLQNVYIAIKNTGTNDGAGSVTSASLGSNEWSNSLGGKLLQNNSVLYFSDFTGSNLNVDISGNNNIDGNKTLVVEGGNIYITANIRNSDNDDAILGLIAIEKDGKGGNIYIDPSVTDIHANIYADKSLVGYNGNELNGNTSDSILANQLYIHGSIFTENTLGGADSIPLKCPFYVTSCNENLAKKYDLNYQRRYILVSEIIKDPITGEIITTGEMSPNNNAAESYMGDASNTNTEIQKPGYRRYPFIIEYNSNIQQSPPPFF